MQEKITFEKIQEANETIRTTNIKGKDYAEVNQRIKAFRMVYPNGDIATELVSNENGVCIFRADVYDEDGNHLGNGTAYEKENSTFINKTSYIENCETSAVGRALGMCGFGIDTSIASAEEVQNAIVNQDKKDATDYRKELINYCNDQDLDMNEIAKQYKLNAKSKQSDFKKALDELRRK